MQTTTPAGNTATDPRNDLTAVQRAELRDRVARLQLGLPGREPPVLEDRHGDVDHDGQIVDELTERLRRSIVAATPTLADEQLAAVRRVVSRVRA